MLEEKYDRPLVQAAKEFGISTTVFKTVCRKNGILRWPHRQIRSINRTIQALKNQATRNQGGQTSIIQDDISDLETKKMIVVVASSCNLDANLRNAIFNSDIVNMKAETATELITSLKKQKASLISTREEKSTASTAKPSSTSDCESNTSTINEIQRLEGAVSDQKMENTQQVVHVEMKNNPTVDCNEVNDSYSLSHQSFPPPIPFETHSFPYMYGQNSLTPPLMMNSPFDVWPDFQPWWYPYQTPWTIPPYPNNTYVSPHPSPSHYTYQATRKLQYPETLAAFQHQTFQHLKLQKRVAPSATLPSKSTSIHSNEWVEEIDPNKKRKLQEEPSEELKNAKKACNPKSDHLKLENEHSKLHEFHEKYGSLIKKDSYQPTGICDIGEPKCSKS